MDAHGERRWIPAFAGMTKVPSLAGMTKVPSLAGMTKVPSLAGMTNVPSLAGMTKVAGLVCMLALGACSETETKVALGTLERDRITLSATAPEIIVAQPVAEGSHVEPGALLVQLDTTLQEAALLRAQAEQAQWQANFDKLQSGFRSEDIDAAQARVESARTLLAESEREITRISGLIERRLASQAEFDRARTQRDAYAAQLRDVEAQLDLLEEGSRTEDLRAAEAQLLASSAAVIAEQQKLANLSVTATRAGTLDSLPWHVGERVATGQQLAILLADGAPYARVYIPETARAAISVGTNLDVHIDGVDTVYNGTVRWIAQEPAFTPYYALNSSERSRLVYLAEVQLPGSATNLPTGLPAQVELPQP